MSKKFVSFALALTLALGAGAALAAAREGDAPVDGRSYPSVLPFIHPPFYNVRLLVETDESGKILKVTDNGTGLAGSIEDQEMEEKWAKKNKPFFDAMLKSGLLEKFAGKTRDEVAAMRMGTGEADAVTGATMVGLAAQEAVLNALDGRKGQTFLPGKGSLMPVAEMQGSTVVLESRLPEGFLPELVDVRFGAANEDVLPRDAYSAEMKDGMLTLRFQQPLKPGKYFVNIRDASRTYRAPNFESGYGEADEAQAPRFVVDSGLQQGDIRMEKGQIILSKGDLQDYLNNLQRVLVLAEGAEKPVEQEKIGHHGTVNARFNLLTGDGKLNPDATLYNKKDRTETPIFEQGKTYEITVVSYGYPDLRVKYTAQ